MLPPFPSGLAEDTAQCAGGKVVIGVNDRDYSGIYGMLEFVV